MLDESGDVGERVACVCPGAEGRPTDIDGVCPVVNGGYAEVGILGRGEQFEFMAGVSHSWLGKGSLRRAGEGFWLGLWIVTY